MCATSDPHAGTSRNRGRLLWTAAGCAVMILCLFPFVYLTGYNLPLFDEFAAMHFRSVMGPWEYQQLLMKTWSGRYTANMLETIYPLRLNLTFFRVLPLLVMLGFTGLIWLNVRALLKRNALFYSLLLFIVLLNFAPSPADLIYYTPALIIYTIAFFLVLAMLRVWTSALSDDAKLYVLAVFHLVVLGTSELFLPVALFISGMLLLVRIRNKQPLLPAIVNLLAVCAGGGVLLSISGNMTRLDTQGNPADLMHCLYNYVRSFWMWTVRFLPALPFVILIVAAMYRADPRRLEAVSDRIGKWQLLSAAAVYPILYAPLLLINLSNYKRLGNVFYFYFLLLSLLLALKVFSKLRLSGPVPKGLLIILIGLFPFAGNIRALYTDIRQGYSRDLYRQLTARYDKLEGLRGSPMATVTPIPKTDYLLSIQDVNDKNDLPIPNPYRPFMFYFEIDTIVEVRPPALP